MKAPKKHKTPSKATGAEARWEKNHEEEFEGIIRLGKNGSQDKKTETRWSKNEEDLPPKKERPKRAESRWEHEDP